MIPGIPTPSLVFVRHPEYCQIKRLFAYFHNIKSHFAKLQFLLVHFVNIRSVPF